MHAHPYVVPGKQHHRESEDRCIERFLTNAFEHRCNGRSECGDETGAHEAAGDSRADEKTSSCNGARCCRDNPDEYRRFERLPENDNG